MMVGSDVEQDRSEFVEVDPTGRYGRYNEILGKGASKTVYRAFDEYEGIEVAWNQVKLHDFLRSPEDLERLYCEIHLLKTLRHKNIMKFYTSWVDTAHRHINFVTEMFTSGTLRQYRLKHKRVNIRAVKHWCRQILRGLLYLHSHDTPIIHRDLKCDNIFVNGHQGEVKIGDLGLAAILRKSHAAHCVGTPEFMAPEVYQEEYNELVDIYSFGMCLLEMVTFEYPYSECTHPAQIYKKVISGKKPEVFYKVKNPEVREFIDKCLVAATHRLSARELLKDPFLQIDENEFDSRLLEYHGDIYDVSPLLSQPFYTPHLSISSLITGYSNHDTENGWGFDGAGSEHNGIEIFSREDDDEHSKDHISIRGKRRDNDGIFLRLRIADKEVELVVKDHDLLAGRVRNIYFPFDIHMDTALSVATEMVAELDITDHDVTKIAEMIDGEISALVPDWEPGPGFEDASPGYCHHCHSTGSSNGSLFDFISSKNGNGKNVSQCTGLECAATHGRFEEITYEAEGSEQCATEGPPVVSSQSDGMHYADIWAQHESADMASEESDVVHLDEESDNLDPSTSGKDDIMKDFFENKEFAARKSLHHRRCHSSDHLSSTNMLSSKDNICNGYKNDIQQELRWLKAKMNDGDHEPRQYCKGEECRVDNTNMVDHLITLPIHEEASTSPLNCLASGMHFSHYPMSSDNNVHESGTPVSEIQSVYDHEVSQTHENSPDYMFTAKSFYTGALPPSLCRSRSLPVDAIEV